MKVTYDKKTDAMYISLKRGRYDHSKKVTKNVLVDVTKSGQIVGVEILDASKNVGKIKPQKLDKYSASYYEEIS